MLTRFHKILIGLLVVQIALAIVVLTRGDDSAARKATPLIAGFDAAKVTKIQIFAPNGTAPAIQLAKQSGGWVLASGFDYPATDAKVGELLAPIAKLAVDAPIATQASRHKQLRVGDAEFERKLVLTIGGKDTTLVIGTAAGSRRTAVRLGGDPRVYAVAGVSAFSIATTPRDWVDPSYLKVGKDDVVKLVVARGDTAVELARDGTQWKASIGGAPLQLAKDETLDTAAIDRILGEATAIDLTAPADPKRDASKPTATITLTRKALANTSAADVAIDVIADGASYWVHDRASPRAVLVDKSKLADVVEIARDKLVKKAPEPQAKGETAPAGKSKPAAPATAKHPG